MFNLENILNDFQNQKVIFLKNQINKNPGWDKFLFALDYKFNNPDRFNSYDRTNQYIYNQGFPTDILLYNKFDLLCNNMIRKDLNINLFEGYDDFLNLTKNLIENSKWSIKAAINFVSNENEYCAHKDSCNVISWQCVGSVIYKIYNSKDFDESSPCETALDFEGKNYTEYLLEPGDVIIMPQGTIHQVKVIEPRSTLILDFFKENKNALAN